MTANKARIQIFSRFLAQSPTPALLRINKVTKRVTVGSIEFTLAPKPYKMLLYLYEQEGKGVEDAELVRAMYDDKAEVEKELSAETRTNNAKASFREKLQGLKLRNHYLVKERKAWRLLYTDKYPHGE